MRANHITRITSDFKMDSIKGLIWLSKISLPGHNSDLLLVGLKREVLGQKFPDGPFLGQKIS